MLKKNHKNIRQNGHWKLETSIKEGDVRVCGDAVLRYFWCSFTEIFNLNCGIAVL